MSKIDEETQDLTEGGAEERAYHFIRAQILGGASRPGERLPEETVAQRIGVSRTPVRAALHRLTSEGFVEFKRHVGAVVKALPSHEVDQLFQVRAVLEGLGAELAALNASPVIIGELELLCDRMEALVASSTPDCVELARLNQQFHKILLAAGGNPHLQRIGGNLNDLNIMINSYSRYSPELFHRSMEHHRELVAALKARNPIWARSVMVSHIEAGRSAARNATEAENADE